MPSALILGASRGLGVGSARRLAGRGWSVTGTVRQEADRAGLEAAGARALPCGITDPAAVAAPRGLADVIVAWRGVPGSRFLDHSNAELAW